MNTHPGASPLIAARNIVKRFGTVLANDRVDFDLHAGEVHALLGENGAGKSTLSKILCGYYRADSGSIEVEGRSVSIAKPADARTLGIGMVYQDFSLVPAMSVLENIALFLPDLPAVVDEGNLRRLITEQARRLHISLDPSAPVGQLTVGDQQKVEILKLLIADVRVLILDEPTKLLAPHEAEALLEIVAELKAAGYAVVFIAHKLREVLACADRITVMRQGRAVECFDRRDATVDDLVSLMFGQEIAPSAAPDGKGAEGEPPNKPSATLELENTSTRGSGSEAGLRNLSLRLHPGEIVGVAGVSGNGQRELGDLILGLRSPAAGRKLLRGEDASRWSVGRIRNSVAFIPEDPLNMGCVPGLSLRENMALGTGRRYHAGIAVDWSRVEADVARAYDRLDFALPPLDAPVATLSGGNLQRAVVVRELLQDPDLIVALYPTRGLDVRSAIAVRERLARARDLGAAVLFVSEDLDELFELSDRLIVMFDGQIAGEFQPPDFRRETVGPLMTGAKESVEAA